jgi:hypothetical protein
LLDLIFFPFSGFGDEHVKYISDHYKFLLLFSKVDVASVPTEWALLKMDVYSR